MVCTAASLDEQVVADGFVWLDHHFYLIKFRSDSESDDETTETIKLAFEKKRSDDRKKWLLNYNKDEVLDNNDKSVPIPYDIIENIIRITDDIKGKKKGFFEE